MGSLDAKTMPWGKYKGKRIDEIESGYLRWVLSKARDNEVNFGDDLQRYTREVLERRGEEEDE